MSNDTSITVDSTNISVNDSRELIADTGTGCVELLPPKEVLAVKKEYSIVGDAFYAGINSDVAPSWLTDLVDGVVNTAVDAGLTDYDLLVQEVRNAIDSINVAKNTYVEQINFTSDVNGLIGTHLDTLNVTNDGKYATITNLDVVKTDSESALALQASDLQATFNDTINSRITQVNTAFAAADQVNADSITALTLSFNDQISGLAGTAEAVTGLQTFVGLDPNDANPGVISDSTWFVSLSNAVYNNDGHVATSINDLKLESQSYADNSSASVENKFSYESSIIMNGKIYSAGFGLDTTGLSQVGKDGLSEATKFDSNFRVNAERFILTSPSFPGVEAKFVIDANGLVIDTPEIAVNSLNGNVIKSNTSITAGSGTDIAIMSGSDPLYRFWAGAAAGADAGYSVDKIGNVKSEKSFSTGKPSYASDTAGFWVGRDAADSNKAKLSIGNAENFMKWDGDKLTIKGNVAVGAYVASNNILLSAPTIRSAPGRVDINQNTHNKLKSFTITTGGVLRLVFDYKLDDSLPVNIPAEFLVKVDGAVKHSETFSNDTYFTKTIDVSLGSYSSKVELWLVGGEVLDGGELTPTKAFVKDVYLKGDRTSGEGVTLD